MSDALQKALATALESFIAEHIAPLQQVLRTELAEALEASVGEAASSSAALSSAYYRMAGARTQAELLQNLLDSSAAFAKRSGLLVVKGDRLNGWRARGFEGPAGDRLRELSLAAEGDGGWRRALAEQAATTGVVEAVPEPLRKVFFDAVGAPIDNRGYLLPLLVRERPVAAVYADSGGAANSLDLAGLDLLTRVAGLCLELSAVRQRSAATAAAAVAAPAAADVIEEQEAPPLPPPVAAAPPAPPPPAPAAARPPGPDFDNIPQAEHDIHKKAYRSAKLLVDDLISYHKDKLEQGRAQGDIYSAIREDFDKSRAYYLKKWSSTPAGNVDYFHQEVIRRLAKDDPSVMGADYPGPLVK